MGYSIPVIYFVCDRSELPESLSKWTDAESAIGAADSNRAKYHMHMATARNWWQLLAITEIRERDQLQGLEFCDGEIKVIDTSDLDVSIRAVERVIAAQIELGNMEAHSESREEDLSDIDCELPGGLGKFLRSLLSVLQRAKREGKVFLFLQPQP
jgi:hypothetical protein